MPLRRQTPLTFVGRGVTDSVDGTDAPEGSLMAAINLIPSRHTKGAWNSRPARRVLTTFSGFTAPGFVSAIQEIGNVAYGLIATGRNPGYDEPFSYNLLTNSFVPISGVTASNVPLSPPTTGPWTPPIIEQVGQRIVFTSIGFPDGSATPAYFNTFYANTVSGSTLLQGIDPGIFEFLQDGMQLQGAGIQPGTTIQSVSSPTVYATASGTSGTPTITVVSATGIVIGQTASGPGIPTAPQTVVTNVVGTTITLSQNLTANLVSAQVVFSGSIVVMSLPATATANNVFVNVISAMPAKFGWLDISGFSTTIQANTVNGLPVLTGNPSLAGLQPGTLIAGTGIPGGTVTLGQSEVVQTLACTFPSGDGHVTLVQAPYQGAIVVGQTVAGAGIPFGTVVTGVTAPFGSAPIISLSQLTTSAGPANLTFSGAFIAISQPATATLNGVTLSLTGGTVAAPQWGSGDTTPNPLPSVPVGVSQRNGRAWFACGLNGIPFSDSLQACIRSSASQALNTGDGLAVTALGPLGQISALTSSVVQATVVFQGATKIQVITGDQATGDLALNELPIDTGTMAPLSISPTTSGLAFISPLGLRIMGFTSNVGDVIGADGEGVSVPFMNDTVPTRIDAAGHDDVIRVTVFSVEFWFHLKTRAWSGPHSLDTSLLTPWDDPSDGKSTFITTSIAHPATLYRSDSYQTLGQSFIEDGFAMSFTYTTSLLPDNPEGWANALNETTVFFRYDNNSQVLATVTDDKGNVMDQAYLWQGPVSASRSTPIFWINAIVARQMTVSLTGTATMALLIGNMKIRYQRLAYQITDRPVKDFILGSSVLGGPDVLAPSP